MTTHPPLHEPAVKVLAYLLDLASRRAGYTVRGAPGWATADQIETSASTWGTSELMRTQVRRGRVLEHDARAPADGKPQWLYRIAQKGADDLAAALGTSASNIRNPPEEEDTRVLLRDPVRHAIEGLRDALDPTRPPRREWISGETGWRSSRDISYSMAREDEAAGVQSYRWFTSDDLRWLVRLGFAEERIVGRTHVYRLTTAGASLLPLEWKEPPRR